MNQDAFVQAVVNTHAEGWIWKLVGEGSKQLRGTHRHGRTGYCPIDVVARVDSGLAPYRSTEGNAANLGLSVGDRVEIQNASDGAIGNPVLRQRLLAAAGL